MQGEPGGSLQNGAGFNVEHLIPPTVVCLVRRKQFKCVWSNLTGSKGFLLPHMRVRSPTYCTQKHGMHQRSTTLHLMISSCAIFCR